MSQFAAPLMAGGMAASALGNLFGATSANRAGRQARDWYGQQTGQGAGRYAAQLYGAPYTQDWVNAGLGDQNSQQRLNDVSGGSLVQQANQIVSTAQGGDVQGRQAQLWNYLQGIYGQGAQQVGNQYQQSSERQLSDFERGAQGLNATVSNYGKGQEDIINRDAAKQQRGMDRTSLARLYGSGLGNSTAVANQLSANARRVGEQRQNSLADLGERVTNKQLGVQGDVLSGRTSLLRGLYSDQNSAIERQVGARQGLETGMAGQDIGLRTGNQDRTLGALGARLNLVNSGAQSSTLNPWLGQNTQGYYPGLNGAALAGQTAGNSLTALAGQLYGQRPYSSQPQNDPYAMYRMQ